MKGMSIGATVAVIAMVSLLMGCERRDDPRPPATEEKSASTESAGPAVNGVIAAVGDSLTAGMGVSEEDAYPAQLEKKLQAGGYRWRVVNAGISGETSSGALSRIGWVLKLKPDIVILETGANDGLRGIDPQVTKRNIDATVRILKENKTTVVLAGMLMSANLGRDYTEAFDSVYPAIAKKYDIILIPFFLAGIAGEPSLNQADGIHPLAEGYRIVTDTVYPFVLQAIEKRRGGD